MATSERPLAQPSTALSQKLLVEEPAQRLHTSRGPRSVRCPHCGVDAGLSCITASGSAARFTHRSRCDRYIAFMRTRRFVVRVRADNERLSVHAGERYAAELYRLDPQKVTLLARIPDGNDPSCNHYWSEVDWEFWA